MKRARTSYKFLVLSYQICGRLSSVAPSKGSSGGGGGNAFHSSFDSSSIAWRLSFSVSHPVTFTRCPRRPVGVLDTLDAVRKINAARRFSPTTGGTRLIITGWCSRWIG